MLKRMRLPSTRQLIDFMIVIGYCFFALQVIEGVNLFLMNWDTRENEAFYSFVRPNFNSKTIESYSYNKSEHSEYFSVRPYFTRTKRVGEERWMESHKYEHTCGCITEYYYDRFGTNFEIMRSSPSDPNITVVQWDGNKRAETLLPAEAAADLFEVAGKQHSSLRAKYKDLVR